ncbi:MAG: acyl-CoA/acyl-ACP dehydrogenase [Pseudomonadales bacterium]|nr:acyl-CoA/acyl-ACP dehydrogenase [Pseudomonadales bacterium]
MTTQAISSNETILGYLSQCEQLISRGLSYIKKQALVEGKVVVAKLDDHQQPIYDLAYSYSEVKSAQHLRTFALDKGDHEQRLANLFSAEVITNIVARLKRSPADIGLTQADFGVENDAFDFCSGQLAQQSLAQLGATIAQTQGDLGDRGLAQEKQMMADTFRQFAEQVVEPMAEDIHRKDLMIPDEIINGLKQLGCFGLSVPERFGGLLPDDEEDSLGMIVVTEELSRASLGGAGSLITRPEIMARALIEGGTKAQQEHWLPKLAQGEPLCGIAITEPDYGSDVASMRLKATQVEGGWLLSGAKAWSTFAGKAGVLLTLARTDPDTSKGHRGLTLFMCEKPSTDDHQFEFSQPDGGKLTGVAIPTLGYRGMHSYQLFFDDFFVPDSHVVGESQGLGRGFYFTMRGFMGGRIQTAARACGVIQAAFDSAVSYANERKVFGKPVASYGLSQAKLARMAAYLVACRQYTYAVGHLMDQGKGQMEASLVKFLACKAAEWISREAMQIHGGMGYAEESAVSRFWLDARVLSIFEGTEETLALKVVGRNLVETAD